jgi:ABC-2 type transport system ATP-binding protein
MMNPKVVVLDEPTSGIDVEHAVAIRDLIKALSRKGVGILLSSHNLIETEILADRVYVISKGRIVAEGSPRELKTKYGVETLEEVYLKAVRGEVA